MVYKTRVSRELLRIGFEGVKIVGSPCLEKLVITEDNGDKYYVRWHPDDPLNLYIDMEPAITKDDTETKLYDKVRAFFKQMDINEEKVAHLKVYKDAEAAIMKHRRQKTKQENKGRESNNEMPESTGSGSLLS